MAIQTALDSISQATGSSPFGYKNRVINGAMVIDQRNGGSSVTATDSSFAVDRFSLRTNQSSKYTAQQNAGSVTPPPGFRNYLGITSLSSYSPASGDYIGVQHKIEGYNVADFDLGLTTAKTWTLSFWVRSSLTGTFGASYRNSAQNRSYAFTYTINQANTWEKKTITTKGDTTGTWLTTNGVGLDLWFNLGSGSTNSTATTDTWQGTAYLTVDGSVNVVGTNGATWYITGVQIELGKTATDFDYRSYGTELIMCQRYFQTYSGLPVAFVGSGNNAQNGWLIMPFPVAMRSAPSATGSVSVKQNATSYTYTIQVINTVATGLTEIYGTSSTNPGYDSPACFYFSSLNLSSEI